MVLYIWFCWLFWGWPTKFCVSKEEPIYSNYVPKYKYIVILPYTTCLIMYIKWNWTYFNIFSLLILFKIRLFILVLWISDGRTCSHFVTFNSKMLLLCCSYCIVFNFFHQVTDKIIAVFLQIKQKDSLDSHVDLYQSVKDTEKIIWTFLKLF